MQIRVPHDITSLFSPTTEMITLQQSTSATAQLGNKPIFVASCNIPKNTLIATSTPFATVLHPALLPWELNYFFKFCWKTLADNSDSALTAIWPELLNILTHLPLNNNDLPLPAAPIGQNHKEDAKLMAAVMAKKLACNAILFNDTSTFLHSNMQHFLHDCLPNARNIVFPDTGQVDVMSRVDIQKGEVITVDHYGVPFDLQHRRKLLLKDFYMYSCNCHCCTSANPTTFPSTVILIAGERIPRCLYCGLNGGKFWCGACKVATYCNVTCQKAHWQLCHKHLCSREFSKK